ncbi:hypothetical protein Cgig2_011431 [Carnegiea gigantea]|uniref:PPIase cyclophilin-type domain-containing protein n=1 Tax=Carnegiea gigantea TaxID=171969 RepID=A0A9Q1KTI9_9CARY|nr:hypothetical protein Cgig2_011431 [Carnegiea gigantea]
MGVRGLVACANAGTPHSNGSQFFITLDRCDWLDKKNTIFGKVTGDSIYNLLRLGEVETDKDDRPLDPPPKIASVEVVWNPFDDIIPRDISKEVPEAATDGANKESKKKAVKKLNLLSFGEEAEEEEEELAAVKQKIKSSHDVLNDPRLLKEEDLSKDMDPAELKSKREAQLSVRGALSLKKEKSQKDVTDGLRDAHVEGDVDDDEDEDDFSFDARMRQQILKKRMEMGDLPVKPKSQSGASKAKDQEKSAVRSDPESSDDQKKVGKLSIKKKGIGSEARADRMANADTDLQLLNNSERERLLQKQKKRRIKGREDDELPSIQGVAPLPEVGVLPMPVLAKLESFKKKNSLSAKSDEPHATSESGVGEDLSDWRTVRLKFAPDSKKDNMSRNEDANDYAVVDPLLEKGKQKFNRMIAKQKRREREWAGRSLT